MVEIRCLPEPGCRSTVPLCLYFCIIEFTELLGTFKISAICLCDIPFSVSVIKYHPYFIEKSNSWHIFGFAKIQTDCVTEKFNCQMLVMMTIKGSLQ
jgi:hypothetical protein